jgi:hypothetical protein
MPKLERAAEATFDLGGVMQEYLRAVTAEWLLKMPDANPAVLDMFADRDKEPYRKLLPWSGEFAGKYLTGAVQVWRLTRDPALKEYLAKFVARLVRLQDADGYLGPFPKEFRLAGKAPNADGLTWDVWGHYHIMLGLLSWNEETGDPAALEAAARIGDLMCRRFSGPDKRIVDTCAGGSTEMNHAALHGLTLLYRKKPSPEYLALARRIIDEFPAKAPDGSPAGDYLRSALAGKEFFQCPKPRWESLHAIMGLAELYRITGEDDCRRAFEHHWWSIVKLDRHNTGGFSSGEQAQGNPYHRGAIETCCTIAWMAMSVEMLRLTGDSVVADELELSTFNGAMGCQSRTGKWCTYNTPMDGRRVPGTIEIAFQKRPGSEQVNCCSANAPRGLGLASEWALMTDAQGLVLNWYGPSTMTARWRDSRMTLREQTDYPRDGKVLIEVTPERPAAMVLKLRVPHWSAATAVRINGAPVPGVKPGTYLSLDRRWSPGDKVEMDLDMSPHVWAGERECAGLASIYRGPILLAARLAAPAMVFSPEWRQYGRLWATDRPGATVEHTFEGAGVQWVGRRFDDAGRSRVTIDGREVAVVDQYGPGRDLPFSWEHKGLAAGKHTIRLTVMEEKTAESRGRFANVIGFTEPGAAADAATGVPELDARRLAATLVTPDGGRLPIVCVGFTAADGRKVRLQDFATAGEDGAEYVSWLRVKNASPVPFSRANPLRSVRPTSE